VTTRRSEAAAQSVEAVIAETVAARTGKSTRPGASTANLTLAGPSSGEEALA
jgi:hypothetical protein